MHPTSPTTQRKYIPSQATFLYRFSFLHFFSLVWMGGLLYATILIARGEIPGIDYPLPMLLGLIPIYAVATWLQMTGWNEQITLGPTGIEWRDWKGKTRVSATLDDITSIQHLPGRAKMIVIETKRGQIKTSMYIRGYGQLGESVKRVVEERNQQIRF